MYGRIARKVMYRQIATGLLAAGIVPMLWADANATCPPDALRRFGNRTVCSTPTSGAGTAVLVITEGFGDNNATQSCPGILTNADGAEGGGGFEPTGGTAGEIGILQFDSIEVTLNGTVRDPNDPSECGPGPDQNQNCDIKGVVFCSADLETARGACPKGQRAEAAGPLLIQAPAPGQTDDSDHTFTGARFQLDFTEQQRLCPDPGITDDNRFVSFVAEEGFFTTCRGEVCQTLFCKVPVRELCRDEVRVYHCKAVSG